MKSNSVKRREFLKMAGVGFSAFLSGGFRANGAEGLGRFSALRDVGTLLPPDLNGIRLPSGFRSRVVARSGASPIDGGASLAWCTGWGGCFCTT